MAESVSSVFFNLSLFDKNKTLVNESNSLINNENNLIIDSNSLLNKNNNLINERHILVDDSKNLVEVSSDGIGAYSIIVQDISTDSYQSSVDISVQKIIKDSYVNGYGEFLEVVTSKDPLAREKFFSYLFDWQWSGQNKDFLSYAESRAEQEKQIALCYDKAIAKFGIGTAIVATTWIVAIVVPGGTIYQVAIIAIAKATTAGAFSGGAIGAVTSCAIGYLQGKRGDDLLCATVNGAADGYLVGAITGIAEGSVKVAKMMKDAKKLKNISGTETIFNGNVYDETGKLIGKYDPKWYPTQKAFRNIKGNYIEGSYAGVELGKSGSGNILRRNFQRYYNKILPEGTQAHHIVPSNATGGGPGGLCREIFEKFGIDINDPHNCCPLPSDKNVAKAINSMCHNGSTIELHGEKILQLLYEDLSSCESKQQVFEVLADYRQAMLTNTPWW